MPSEDGQNKIWGVFKAPVEIICTCDVNEVATLLELIECKVRDGGFAAGFISYEASPAFDESHVVKTPREFPLLWFGVYDSAPEVFVPGELTSIDFKNINSTPELDQEEYITAVKKIENYIREGDIYQANFTFRSKISLNEPNPENLPYQLFESLFQSHPVPYAAYVNTGQIELLSNSPELFLEKNGSVIRSMPMKGTAHRKLTGSEDLKVAADLARDAKNRAENIMIVDMVRNDLGRICNLGSVKAGPIWHVDTYNTVHQMISCVEGKLPDGISLLDIFGATFPAASITGAPKIRAMQIIDELEKSPRKAYTGSIGCMIPGGDFSFNVAIRTLICSDKGIELGIGSGIVADSNPVDEWQESLLKSKFISRKLPDFKLLETILWTKEKGFIYLEEHLERLRISHLYFLWKWNRAQIIGELEKTVANFSAEEYARVRLLASSKGDVEVDIYPLNKQGWGEGELKIKISNAKTDSGDLFLYHKTTNREFYNYQYKQAVSEGYDEVIFFNEKKEVTEGAISNIFIRKGDSWFTPPINCGLLPGVWRSVKIAALNAVEKIIYLDDLQNADEILIGNSVRGEAVGRLLSGRS